MTNSMGKAFFDAAEARAPVHPEIKKINVAANGSIAAAGFAGGGPSASALFLLRRMQRDIRQATGAICKNVAKDSSLYFGRIGRRF